MSIPIVLDITLVLCYTSFSEPNATRNGETTMNKTQLKTQLVSENLRLATEMEAGYTYRYQNEYKEIVVVWVTDIN